MKISMEFCQIFLCISFQQELIDFELKMVFLNLQFHRKYIQLTIYQIFNCIDFIWLVQGSYNMVFQHLFEQIQNVILIIYLNRSLLL